MFKKKTKKDKEETRQHEAVDVPEEEEVVSEESLNTENPSDEVVKEEPEVKEKKEVGEEIPETPKELTEEQAISVFANHETRIQQLESYILRLKNL